MVKAFTIIALFYSTLTLGQVSKANNLENIDDGLTITDSISWKNIVGEFYTSDGFGGYKFQLESNFTFHKNEFSCLSHSTVDSGTWSIINYNKVVLKSNKQTIYYDIFKFDCFYFFIIPTQRQQFLSDLQITKTQLNHVKPFQIDGKTYDKNYLIGFSLGKKYLVKDLTVIPGT